MTLASRRLCTAAALLYSVWILYPLVNRELHPWTSFVSEYFVADLPGATVLRTVDGVAGVVLAGVAAFSYARLRTLWRALPNGARGTQPAREVTSSRNRTAVRVWCAGLGVAGLATVVDAVNPLVCAVSLSAECAAAEKAGTLPLQHQVHLFSSGAAGLGFVAAMIATLVLSTRTDRLVRVLSWVGIVLIVFSGIDALVPQLPTHGISQRLSMVAIAVWLIAAAGVPVTQRLRPRGSGSNPTGPATSAPGSELTV